MSKNLPSYEVQQDILTKIKSLGDTQTAGTRMHVAEGVSLNGNLYISVGDFTGKGVIVGMYFMENTSYNTVFHKSYDCKIIKDGVTTDVKIPMYHFIAVEDMFNSRYQLYMKSPTNIAMNVLIVYKLLT